MTIQGWPLVNKLARLGQPGTVGPVAGLAWLGPRGIPLGFLWVPGGSWGVPRGSWGFLGLDLASIWA